MVKRIAAVVTVYGKNSHADVIVGKFMRGFPTDEGVLAPVAVGETVICAAHPPLPLVGVSIWMGRGCQQNDSLADG